MKPNFGICVCNTFYFVNGDCGYWLGYLYMEQVMAAENLLIKINFSAEIIIFG